jgi:hypothetical protein
MKAVYILTMSLQNPFEQLNIYNGIVADARIFKDPRGEGFIMVDAQPHIYKEFEQLIIF